MFPNAELLAEDDVPTIALGGVKWPIAGLVPRQLKIVVPLIMNTMPAIAKNAISEETVEAMCRIVFVAIERGHKGLTREEFDDMPMGLDELADGVVVVMKRSGMFKEKASPGEAPGSSPTGPR
jgi:hypothetical protein